MFTSVLYILEGFLFFGFSDFTRVPFVHGLRVLLRALWALFYFLIVEWGFSVLSVLRACILGFGGFAECFIRISTALCCGFKDVYTGLGLWS